MVQVYIHYRNTQNLLIELFKVKNSLPPENVTDTFSQQSQTQSNSSVIWKKGKSQNRCNKNTKQAKFSEKRTFFTP